MTVYETDLPNVGRKFELPLDGGRRLVVVIQFNGTRVLYEQAGEGADAEKVAELTSEEGRRLGAILAGAYFETETSQPEVPLGDERIEWVTVPDGSALVGETLGDADVGERTGATVIAVQHDEETVGNPDADQPLDAGDTLVVLGGKRALAALDALLHEE